MEGEEEMSQENERDPWDEVEGVPPYLQWRLKFWRQIGATLPSWRTTLGQLMETSGWTSEHLCELTWLMDVAFGTNERLRVSSEALDTFKLLREVVQMSVQQMLPALELSSKLHQQLTKEIEDALRANQAGLDHN